MIRQRIVILLLVLLLLSLVSACKKPSTVEVNIDRSACNGCGRCLQVCPYDAIELDNNGKAVIDQTLCKQDGLCVRECPQNAIY
jgi:ferredoxin